MKREIKAMSAKKRPLPKPKAVIRTDSSQTPTIGTAELVSLYAEVRRLRQAVRQAESLARRTKIGFVLQ
jgi:hypothetical protein